MADVSQLGYSTLIDIMSNYSSTDAGATFVLPKRVLDRMTPLVRMMPLKASNNILSNIAARTDSLPVASTRRWNEGIKATTSKNAPLNDPIALFEDYSEVDKDLWEIQNNPNVWRADQDMNHVEGLFQLMESTLLYGYLANNPGGFNGLATRFNNLESYPNGDQCWAPNVWNGGASSGNVTCAWMIEFGDDSVYGIYPPNTPAGLSVRDLGRSPRNLPEPLGRSEQTTCTRFSAPCFAGIWACRLPTNAASSASATSTPPCCPATTSMKISSLRPKTTCRGLVKLRAR